MEGVWEQMIMPEEEDQLLVATSGLLGLWSMIADSDGKQRHRRQRVQKKLSAGLLHLLTCTWGPQSCMANWPFVSAILGKIVIIYRVWSFIA